MAKALSISILFLITKLNCQQGYGCPIKTCPIAGQVRTNIVTNAQGQYLSGCECVGEYLSIPYIWTAQQPHTNRTTNTTNRTTNTTNRTTTTTHSTTTTNSTTTTTNRTTTTDWHTDKSNMSNRNIMSMSARSYW
eukprot:369503_1